MADATGGVYRPVIHTDNMPPHEYRYIGNKRPIHTTQLYIDTWCRLTRSSTICSVTAGGQSSVRLTPTLTIHCIKRHSTVSMSCFFTFSARIMALTLFPRRRQQVSRYRCIAPRRAAPRQIPR